MKSRAVFLILIFLFLSALLFARGAQDAETEIKTQNDEWILCVTDFDTSSLPPNKLIAAGVIARKIVERISAINYRTRISPEYAYYESYAWARARSVAAKALSAKVEERSQQIYRGEPDWRYSQNIAKIDAEIEKLRAALEEVENSAPLINREPIFKLTSGNLNFTFPSAPDSGSENRFCSAQKADAFLAGSVIDFHGRFYLSVKLYTVYTRSFVWEDSIIFSHEDLDNAIDEVTRRLLVVLSGNRPAAVAIKAEPQETLLLINMSFAGRGETGILEHLPGTVTVTASAPNHESLSFETELSPGELTEIKINLKQIEYGDVEISGDLKGNVYHGALYVGEAPLTLRLPVGRMEYIEFEAENKQRGTIVFEMPDASSLTRMPVRTGPPLKGGRVDRARRQYYWAWGATWVTGIAAWILYQNFVSANAAVNYNFYQTGSYNQQFYNDNMRMYDISNGALIAVSVVAVYDLFQLGRYLYIANKGSTPVSRTGGK